MEALLFQIRALSPIPGPSPGCRDARRRGYLIERITPVGVTEGLSERALRIIEGRNFAHLATLMPDGSPHVTPVWIDREEEVLLVNTAEGRVKHRNVLRDPRVAISITDQEDPYESVILRGRVVEVTGEGAEEHIDHLSWKYTGRSFQRIPGQKRVIIRIELTSVSS